MSASAPRTATAWGFLAPALLLLGVSVLIPAAMALVMAFTRSGLDVSEPLRFIGLANFRRLLADPMMARVSLTTGAYLLGIVPPIVLGSLALAVLVNRQLPGMHWFRGAFYTPVLVSIVVAAIAFRWLYADNGLINGWMVALLGERFSHTDRVSELPPAGPAGRDGGDPVERPWLLHGDLFGRAAGHCSRAL
jgi:putative chitobiose transport system permease protein